MARPKTIRRLKNAAITYRSCAELMLPTAIAVNGASTPFAVCRYVDANHAINCDSAIDARTTRWGEYLSNALDSGSAGENGWPDSPDSV
ncbi:hypothetical protein WJ542_21300 [Paraburkholderia sp. B3]|uniref:hypothetical protein n=1 Tax=Paraburkholderia sp. B3 TaxID=3134791 RepID=UPI0039829F96